MDEDAFVNNTRKASADDIERLVNVSQGGNRDAFDELVRLYQRRAMQVATRVLGSANDAGEAVQAGFLKAYLSIGKLKEAKQFEVWLLRIVSNAAISQARATKRRRQKTKIADYFEHKKTLSPVESQSCEELKEAVRRAMLKLSKKEAKAIALFGLENLSHREVSEIMGCSVEATKWYVFRARQKLKVLLREYLE